MPRKIILVCIGNETNILCFVQTAVNNKEKLDI